MSDTTSASPITAYRNGFHGRAETTQDEEAFLRDSGSVSAYTRADGTVRFGVERMQSTGELGAYRAQFAPDPNIEYLSGAAHDRYEQLTDRYDSISADPVRGEVRLEERGGQTGVIIRDRSLAKSVAFDINFITTQSGEGPLTRGEFTMMRESTEALTERIDSGAFAGRIEAYNLVPAGPVLGEARTVSLDDAPATHSAPNRPAGLPEAAATAALNIGSQIKGTLGTDSITMEDVGVQGGKERSGSLGIQ